MGELNETVAKGFFVAPTAQTIADMGKAKPEAKPETADDLTFIDDLVSGRSNVSPADAALLQRWLGVQVNENGELEVSEEGAASYTTLGATLTDEKTGKKGITRQAVEGRIQRALKAAGAPNGLTRERVAERIAARAAGTDMDTMQRSMDQATPAAPLDGTATETAEGQARAAEMEAGTNDDVGTAEEGTTDTAPDVLLAEQDQAFEMGTLRGYLKDDLQSGRVLKSDIAEAIFLYETARGQNSFTSNPVSRQAEAVRHYARARVAGDPAVAENQKALNEQAKTRAEPAASNPEADGRGNQADTGVEPAATENDGQDIRAGSQVPQAGNQAQAPIVKVKKRRTAAQVNEDVLGGQPDLPINQDVIERDPPDTRAARPAADPQLAAKIKEQEGVVDRLRKLVACLSK